jgi:hypothetical protein
LYYFHKKINKKNQKKTFLVVNFGLVFLGGFFIANPGRRRRRGPSRRPRRRAS